jgi:TonB-dependent starch-binding outer membrane protein SusC
MQLTVVCKTAIYLPLKQAIVNPQTLKVMRLTAVFLFALCMHVCANGVGQQVSVNVENVPAKKVFRFIQKQTGLSFFIDESLLNKSKNVTLHVKDVSLQSVIDACFTVPVNMEIVEKTIVVSVKPPALTNNLNPSLSINIPPVTGIIRGPDGQPIAGANVVVKGTKRGITTDAKGGFSIAANDGDVITISSVGFSDRQLIIKNNDIGIVVLSLSESKLDEVQIIAYGTTTKRLNTGNISTVKAADIEKQPVSNALAALQGRVPGLLITQVSGMPGSGFNIQIRGQNSISQGSLPFYVVDGVPYESKMPELSLNGALQGGTGGPLNYINPNDIESIEVLKDADATSIYGSRAANGAILITTKKGKAGSMKVNANAYSGFTKPARDIKQLNTQQYLEMRKEAFKNDGSSPGPADYDVNGTWDSERYTDWSKVFTRNTAHYTNAQVNVSGGSQNTQYLVGVGYYRQNTGLPVLKKGDGINQNISTHFNLTSSSANQRFRLSLTGSYLSNNNRSQTRDFSVLRFLYAPNAPALFNSDGSLNWAPISPGQTGTWSNPYALLLIGYKGLTNNIVSNATLSYMLLPNLEIKASVGYNNLQGNETQTTPTTYYDPGLHVTSGSSSFRTTSIRSWIAEPQVNYKLEIGKSTMTILAGGSFNAKDNDVKTLNAFGFVNDILLENIQAATRINSTSSNLKYRYNAVFGRLNYNFSNKYLLNVTVRRDGSSRFGPGRQFANFAAAGLGWIFSSESWLKESLPFLSFGKLRGSYGTTGNDQILDYQFLDVYSLTGNSYQQTKGLYPENLFNAQLAWETTRKLEVGIELGFLRDRITIQVSYYRNRSGNQLLSAPLPLTTGFASITSNLPGLIQNKGLELSLSTVNAKAKNFTWSSNFNLTKASNKLLAFPYLHETGYDYYYTIGQPVRIIKVFQYAGLNSNTGLYQFYDSKGTVVNQPTDPDDKKSVSVIPKYYGGFQNSIIYKSFSLDFLLQFTKQTGRNILASLENPPGWKSSIPLSLFERWKNPGDITKYQQFTQTYTDAYLSNYYVTQSDFVYTNASFIRLKNASLSYQLPAAWKKKARLENCRVYMLAQNLFTITKYDGIDPETQGIGLPPMKVWTVGIEIGL